jgi:hypothetical protein
MVKSERQRQKKLAKRQKRASTVRKLARIHRNPSTRDVILQALGTPWEVAFKRENEGMASVVAMRRMRVGNPISVCFLIDSYCLGVKDAYISRDIDIDRLREMIRQGGDEVTLLTPEYIAKWVPEAIAYARSIGIEPSKNAELCLLMFSDVDASHCNEEFVFGKDGKPLYISGPNDPPEQIERVLRTLEKLGAGNFNFTLSTGAGVGRSLRADNGEFLEGRYEEFDLADLDEEFEYEYEGFDVDSQEESTESGTVDSVDIKRIE